MQKLDILKTQSSARSALSTLPTPTFIRLDAAGPYRKGVRASAVERFEIENGTFRVYTKSRHGISVHGVTHEQFDAALRTVLINEPQGDRSCLPMTFRGHAFEAQKSVLPTAVDGYAFGPAGFTLYLQSGAFFIVPTAGAQMFMESFSRLYGEEYLIPRVLPVQPNIPPDQMVDPLGHDFSAHMPFQR